MALNMLKTARPLDVGQQAGDDPRPLTIPEHLLLLALDEGRGAFREGFDHGLAGAALAELDVTGRIEITRTAVSTAAAAPTGDRSLDAVSGLIGATEPVRSPAEWVSVLARTGLRERTIERLIARGILEERQRSPLGRWGRNRYRIAPPRLRIFLLARFHHSALAGGALERRQATLVALTVACGLLESLFAPAVRTRARAAAAGLVSRDVVARAVADALERGQRDAAARVG